MQRASSRTIRGLTARIMVVLALGFLSLPLFYLGLFGVYGLFLIDSSVSPVGVAMILSGVAMILTPVLLVFSVAGTFLSYRHALITVAALAVFYLSWATTVYPFPDLAPISFFHGARWATFAILCLNLAWMAWALFTPQTVRE